MRLFSSTSVLPPPDVRTAISGGLLAHERSLAALARDTMRTNFDLAAFKHGRLLVGIAADVYGPLWESTLRALSDCSPSGYTLNEERLDTWAADWAREELTGLALRLVRLSAALAGLNVAGATDTAFFVIEGRHPKGQRVRIEVRRTLTLKGGRLYNQFPVVVYIDGKHSTAARLHEL